MVPISGTPKRQFKAVGNSRSRLLGLGMLYQLRGDDNTCLVLFQETRTLLIRNAPSHFSAARRCAPCFAVLWQFRPPTFQEGILKKREPCTKHAGSNSLKSRDNRPSMESTEQKMGTQAGCRFFDKLHPCAVVQYKNVASPLRGWWRGCGVLGLEMASKLRSECHPICAPNVIRFEP